MKDWTSKGNFLIFLVLNTQTFIGFYILFLENKMIGKRGGGRKMIYRENNTSNLSLFYVKLLKIYVPGIYPSWIYRVQISLVKID